MQLFCCVWLVSACTRGGRLTSSACHKSIRHRLRAKVEIQNFSQDMAAWQRYGGSLQKEDSESELSEAGGIGWGASTDTTGQVAAESNNKAWKWWKDPRLSALGLRGVFPVNAPRKYQPPCGFLAGYALASFKVS